MATFRRYLVFQAVTFVFGIVGPIFLIGFFATQPDPTVKWMFWWGLLITAIDVFVALELTKASVRADRKAHRSRQARRDAQQRG